MPMQELLDMALPSGVISHSMRLVNGKYKVIYCDFNCIEVYFEKEYLFKTEDQFKNELLSDAKAFNEVWKSPLMNALKEKE